MWNPAIVVFLGGALGAMIREFLMLGVPHQASGFPLDIFIANIVAAFLLGWATGLNKKKVVSDEFMLLFGTGMMGGMSTFSSFAYGAYHEMIQPGGMIVSLAYLGASMIVGYGAVWLGMALGRRRTAT